MPKKIDHLNPKDLLNDYKNGFTVEEIGYKYNISNVTTRKLILEYANVNTLKDIQLYKFGKVRRLYKLGKTPLQISKILGINKNIIWVYVAKAKKIEEKQFAHVRDYEKSKENPCKICGRDKGANRWYCDRCLHNLSGGIDETVNLVLRR